MKFHKYTESYVWLVSYCPDAPELVGRKFRSLDLQYGVWPEGTTFTNVRTGEVRVWKNGNGMSLNTETAHSKEIT